MSEQIYVGVDIGGTAIKVGICNQSGDLLHTYEGPTESDKGTDVILHNIATYAKRIVEQSPYEWEQVGGVGVGIAGFLDIPNGFVKFSPNLGLRDVRLKDYLEEHLNKTVRINNDANVAALGEVWAGAGKGVDHCVCYTLGTGVGGGIIVNGKIYEGFNGMAGELGHMQIVPDLEAIQCGCGKMGCLETVSSATGIIRMAKDAVERGDRTSLSLVEHIMAKEVIDAAKAGDEVASRIVNRAAYYLGKSMASVAVVLNPQRFIVGGGVSKAGEFLFEQIRQEFRKYTPDAIAENVEIVAATLGNDAGVVGAAGLILRS
ncbi:glucokinase [Paenibacillus cellulosilyticus]|uniref:Glucokinase n=1 Tax=Paenibacillus cellulosilyticus TaxID=375489 RepID=A0A2V2YTR6_9BACL|nr:ROK family glucokinase [Paenibacillus cellulosilyticus]PWW03132.1 glucokinase [Paenibacillus cellulosilyticus]QKS43633.1 ROK family glucokinase [Paenibacillus cellulosilyticus]